MKTVRGEEGASEAIMSMTIVAEVCAIVVVIALLIFFFAKRRIRTRLLEEQMTIKKDCSSILRRLQELKEHKNDQPPADADGD